jgi:hypothetical protein
MNDELEIDLERSRRDLIEATSQQLSAGDRGNSKTLGQNTRESQ